MKNKKYTLQLAVRKLERKAVKKMKTLVKGLIALLIFGAMIGLNLENAEAADLTTNSVAIQELARHHHKPVPPPPPPPRHHDKHKYRNHRDYDFFWMNPPPPPPHHHGGHHRPHRW